MGKQNIAVVGLGRVGSDFLKELMKQGNQGFHIVCAAEINDTPGKKEAQDAGVTLCSLEEIIAKGDGIDIVFDLTGNKNVRREMRDALSDSNNTHTVIAPENVAHIIWSLLTHKPLPDVHTHTGY